jgi:hypothetical protein
MKKLWVRPGWGARGDRVKSPTPAVHLPSRKGSGWGSGREGATRGLRPRAGRGAPGRREAAAGRRGPPSWERCSLSSQQTRKSRSAAVTKKPRDLHPKCDLLLLAVSKPTLILSMNRTSNGINMCPRKIFQEIRYL